MTRDDETNPLPGARSGARSGNAHRRAEEAERLFGGKDRRQVEEANAALGKKRSERPSTLGDTQVEGKFGSPD